MAQRNIIFSSSSKKLLIGAAALALVLLNGCSKGPETVAGIKKLPSGQQYSGFLKDYSAMKANADIGPEAMTYVHQDKMKSLHRYIAVIIDPVDIYVSTDADTSLIPTASKDAVTGYFKHALMNSVESAFPITDTPGPLVLRLRSALVGIDVGGPLAPEQAGKDPMKRSIVMEKVGVEMELVESETGERIAAFVDKEKLGAGAQIGSVNFSREERFKEATSAFDEWAGRVRMFLDSAHELDTADADRAKAAYLPYAPR